MKITGIAYRVESVTSYFESRISGHHTKTLPAWCNFDDGDEDKHSKEQDECAEIERFSNNCQEK